MSKTIKIKEVICPKCGGITFDEIDIENIEEFGECMLCDKMRSDIMESNLSDEE